MYNPQGLLPTNKLRKKNTSYTDASFSERKSHRDTIQEFTNYPKSIISFDLESKPIHPTQKPVELFKYLIRTYTNEGDLVLDNCIGSGTTAVACKQTNRRFIGIDNNQEYVNMANKRLNFTTVGDFNLPTEESLISVKRESADSQNPPHDSSTIKEEANFS